MIRTLTKVIRMYKSNKPRVPLVKEPDENSGGMSIEDYSRPTKTKHKRSSNESKPKTTNRDLSYHMETLRLVC